MNLAVWLPILKFLGLGVMGLAALALTAWDGRGSGKQARREAHLPSKAA